MLAPTGRVARGTRHLALAIVFLVGGLLPAAVFTIGYERAVGAVEAKLEIATGHVNDVVNASPDLWHLQILRIEDIVVRHRSASAPESWQVLDGQERLVVTVAELQTRQARLEALLAIGRELSRIQPVEPMLRRVAEACGRLFDAESAAFRLLEGDMLPLSGSRGTDRRRHARAAAQDRREPDRHRGRHR